MGLTKEEVVGFLKQHGVAFEAFEHPAVATCEAQAEALKDVGGQVTKSLFLRDKKRRQYLITALPDTKVDLKVLSARLGCGKGGLSWASEELLAESLQVAPGCVTPLALANSDSAKHVVLLLDHKLQSAGRFFVHPIVNTASVLVDAAGLDAFVRGVGRQPVYVDLEADPKIDRDHPPDLKQHADSVEPPAKEDGEQQQQPAPSGSSASSSQASLPAAAAAAAPPKAAKQKKAAGKGGGDAAAVAGPSAAEQHMVLTNVVQRTDELIDMVSRALLGKPAAEAAAADGYALRRLRADVQMQLTAFKNAAYTSGYTAGKQEVVAFATKRYA